MIDYIVLLWIDLTDSARYHSAFFFSASLVSLFFFDLKKITLYGIERVFGCDDA